MSASSNSRVEAKQTGWKPADRINSDERLPHRLIVIDNNDKRLLRFTLPLWR